MSKLLSSIKKFALHIALLQAWTATIGSLIYSEIIGLTPCLLCWYQRILMYPLVILFSVALIRKERSIAYYALPMTMIGTLIGFYQYLLQMTPLGRVELTKCDIVNPCSAIDAIYFGFITIPFMSMVSFFVISLMMVILIKSKN